MGKTSRPITIVALPPCSEWEELDKLEAQGHKIIRVIEPIGETAPNELLARVLLDADIILGPNCWRMDTQHKSYLGLAVKEARMLRYRYVYERADSKNRASAVADIGIDGDQPSTD